MIGITFEVYQDTLIALRVFFTTHVITKSLVIFMKMLIYLVKKKVTREQSQNYKSKERLTRKASVGTLIQTK